jgi:hypothetical protein
MPLSEEVVRQAEHDFGVLQKRGTLTLMLGASGAMAVLTCLQLALRDPRSAGPGADIARGIAEQIGEWLSVSDECKAFVDAAWAEVEQNQGG